MKSETRFLLNEKYAGKKSLRFYFDLALLYLLYPLAYLIKTQPFLNINLKIKHSVLIPRPETEYWLERCVFPLFDKSAKLDVLDIFAGSGALGLAFAKNYPNSHVVLSDKNKHFVSLIRENIAFNKISNAEARQSDLFYAINNKKFDLILANPPYVSFFEFNFSFPVLYEDFRSIFAKDNGLFFVKKTLKEAQFYLKDGAFLFLEFDPWQKDKIKKYIKEEALPYEFIFLKDQYGKVRILRAQKSDGGPTSI